MTYRQFLTKLRKTPRDWYLDGRCIRRTSRLFNVHQCPMAAVQGAFISMSLPFHHGGALGLSDQLANSIANAADGGSRSKLYPDLLRACGLQKKKSRKS